MFKFSKIFYLFLLTFYSFFVFADYRGTCSYINQDTQYGKDYIYIKENFDVVKVTKKLGCNIGDSATCNNHDVVYVDNFNYVPNTAYKNTEKSFYVCVEGWPDQWKAIDILSDENHCVNELCSILKEKLEKHPKKENIEAVSETYYLYNIANQDFVFFNDDKPLIATNRTQLCVCKKTELAFTPVLEQPKKPVQGKQPKKRCICDKYDIERIKNERIGNCIEAENKKKEIIERCEKIKNKKSDQICDWFTELKNDFNRNIEKCKNDEENYIRSKYSKIELKLKSLDISVWKDKEGNFNKTRLISDSVAGVVLGTAGGLITSSVIKKNQIEDGFEDISCAIGGQIVSSYGDEFIVGIH